MAKKRMFSPSIMNSDAFLDMPDSSQNLYIHLNINADDDGFVGSPRTIMRMTRKSDDDLKLLVAKKFIIPFDSGVVAIKHWLIHNYIRPDRYKPTNYRDELSRLYLKDNRSYTLNYLKGIPMVALDKKRIDKDRKEIEEIEEIEIPKPKKPETKPKKDYPSISEQIESFSNDEELKNILIQFVAMRTKLRKNLTEYAFHLILKKISKLSSDIDEQKDILNQSIVNSWQDIYEIKKGYQRVYHKRERSKPDWHEKYEEQINNIPKKEEDLSQEEIEEILENAKKEYLKNGKK